MRLCVKQLQSMNITCVKETCLYVSDLERTRKFYADQLGLSVLTFLPNRHVFFRAGNSVLLCFNAAATEKETDLPPHGARGSIHFAFEVEADEYQATLDFIRSKGITILKEQKWKNGFHSFYFNDPDGHLVEVVERGLWG